MKKIIAITTGIVAGLFVAGCALAARNHSSGTYSLPSGNPVVGNTTITATWGNTTMADIATELTDSLSRSGYGGMLGPLRLPNGSVSAPALSYTSETNTGLYRVGANDLGFAINGIKVADLTASLLSTTNNLTLTGSNPASTTAFTSTLTPMNIPKAWAFLNTNGAGSCTINSGFNISGATCAFSGNNIQVTLAQAMANTNYAVLCTASTAICTSGAASASVASTALYKTDGTGVINPAVTSTIVYMAIFGAQ